MRIFTLLFFGLPLCLSFATLNGKTVQERAEKMGCAEVCKKLSQIISSASSVYFPGNSKYTADITAWSPTNQLSASCVIEPGNSKDVAATLKILGEMKANFAVKSGGHSPNPGFSSTVGVLVAMHRFVGVKYDSVSQTAVIGTGMIWDDVYQALEPYNVSVLGARASGVGVGGFLLGGGYSYKANQYGLAIDTITAYELVQPNGKIITVTEQSHSDLFFGLKGGFNNFGIVTRFTVKTFPQTAVWGGVIEYGATHLESVKAAFIDFTSEDRDPKASIMTSFTSTPSIFVITQTLFYDGPSRPTGLFDKFLSIPSIASDISERSLLSMVRSQPSNATNGLRNSYGTVPIYKYSDLVVDAIYNETTFWGGELQNASLVAASYVMEPFFSSILSHNTEPTAYPSGRSHAFFPLNINYVWTSATDDRDFFSATDQSQTELQSSVQPSQSLTLDASFYPNYALPDTPLERMYGTNVEKLKALKRKVDPNNVMGLAGGFKF